MFKSGEFYLPDLCQPVKLISLNNEILRRPQAKPFFEAFDSWPGNQV